MAAVKLFTEETLAGYPKDNLIPMSIEGLTSTLFFTTFRGSSDLNFQINYAFNSDIYSYVFGDKLSTANISGIAFRNVCENSDIKSAPKDFIDYYNKYKLGAPTAVRPLRITIGGMTLSGYFISLKTDLITGKDDTYAFSFVFLGRVK